MQQSTAITVQLEFDAAPSASLSSNEVITQTMNSQKARVQQIAAAFVRAHLGCYTHPYAQ